MSVLVTGGAGYIGSHTVVELLKAGQEVVIVDNYSNSKPEVLNRIKTITGKAPTFYEVDVLDREALDAVFAKENIDSVIHFAGYKAVGESVAKPIEYYHNNITSSLGIVRCDAQPWREEDRLQLIGYGLRHEQCVAVDGGPAY